MKQDNGKWLIVLVMIITLIIATGFILYDQTEWFKRFIKWWAWAYDGLRKWHWDPFVYP